MDISGKKHARFGLYVTTQKALRNFVKPVAAAM